jgi:hypothetical protein
MSPERRARNAKATRDMLQAEDSNELGQAHEKSQQEIAQQADK